MSEKYYIVASTYDEGLGNGKYKLIKAESKVEIIKNIRSHPDSWRTYLERSYPSIRGFYNREFIVKPNGDRSLWEIVTRDNPTVEELTDYIYLTRVNGDSSAKFDILEVAVESLT